MQFPDDIFMGPLFAPHLIFPFPGGWNMDVMTCTGFEHMAVDTTLGMAGHQETRNLN